MKFSMLYRKRESFEHPNPSKVISKNLPLLMISSEEKPFIVVVSFIRGIFMSLCSLSTDSLILWTVCGSNQILNYFFLGEILEI